MKKVILVRGCGDVGSAVALTLFRAGHAVIIHDSVQPTATRRKMAFCDAMFDGSAVLEGVCGMRIDNLSQITASLHSGNVIPLITLDIHTVLEGLQPDILVDARMKKHDQPEVQIALAPLTIGLGPNFIAGETVNEDLGKIIWKGATRPLEGEPQTIAGHARDRYVYAPVEGIFRTSSQIGSIVAEAEEVAAIGEISLRAPIRGMLRGLTHDGVPVAKKTKVIEVDPRGDQAQVAGIANRPGQIANGVLEAVKLAIIQGEANR
jgi:xanthine dehydrogenase accessory factor